MTARRQSSTTSLSKYAHDPAYQQQDEQQPNSLDFCNAFWGVADGGVDVLFARMRGASRTVEELRNFFKERALIEEDYAKRMAKLSKQALGRDEIGEMRACLDTLRTETEKQSTFHQTLSQQIHNEMENLVTEFLGKQQAHKKNYQTAIERQFKAKQTQESYVSKAKEKYEFDCLRINSYTAQSSLVQGRELEKIQMKLQRAEQTVQANERDFANFTRALGETTQKWELDWKTFCDSCQDLEEARMDFLKDIMWAFANSVSTVCVSDDESCERLRLSLEQMETVRDMENFVRDYGTGPIIPDPPPFISYNSEGASSSSSRPMQRNAQFARSSSRPPRPPPEELAAEPEPQEPPVNMVGVGAGGGASASAAAPQSDLTGGSGMVRKGTIRTINGASSPQIPPQPTGSPSKPTSATSPTKPSAGPSNSSNVELKIGSKSYPVDPNRDPQVSGPSRGTPNGTGRATGSSLDASSDPLAAQMQMLMKGGPSAGSSALSPPVSSSPSRQQQQQNNDYRRSAEFVVGAPPPQTSRSRASSPQPPPSPVMMKAPLDGAGSTSGIHEAYEQKLPGETRRRNSFIAPSPSQQEAMGQGLNRPPSVGYAGVGAGSRSNSPQPQHHQQQQHQQQQNQQQQHNAAPPRGNFMQPPPNATPVRAASPNSVGIALDASGRVAIDAMAQGYAQPPRGHSPGGQMVKQRRGSYVGPPTNGVSPQPPRQSPAHAHTPSGHNSSNSWAGRGTSPAPGHNPTGSWGRGTSPAPPAVAHQPLQQPQQQPGFGGQMVQHPGYAPNWQQQQHQAVPQQHPPQPQHPPQGYPGHQSHPSQGHNPPPPQQQPHLQQAGYSPVHPQQAYGDPRYVQQQPLNGLVRGQSMSIAPPGGYHPQQQPQQQMVVQQQQPHMQPQQYAHHLQQPSYGQPQQARGFQHRTPSPQPPAPPTGQSTEDGYGILFYVKALYDYQATTEQEFDFQAGDIIAVTETPEDGWWSGELLDEARRMKGRNVFPSNFVCLLE